MLTLGVFKRADRIIANDIEIRAALQGTVSILSPAKVLSNVLDALRIAAGVNPRRDPADVTVFTTLIGLAREENVRDLLSAFRRVRRYVKRFPSIAQTA
jgi:hypothetical protein